MNLDAYDFIWTQRTGPILIKDEGLQFVLPETELVHCMDIDNVRYLPDGLSAAALAAFEWDRMKQLEDEAPPREPLTIEE